jgi:hypothetical protein
MGYLPPDRQETPMAQSASHPEHRTAHPAAHGAQPTAPHGAPPTAHAGDPDHFVPGSMNIAVQEATFDGFMRLVVRSGIVIALILIFLALLNLS